MNLRVNIPANLRYGITVVGLLLLVNTLLRIAFYLYNRDGADVLSVQDVMFGFLLGIRFDLATIFIFNGLILCFMALPLRCNMRRQTYKVINILIILVNIPVMLMNFIDMVYFGFAEKRMTHELFTTQSDFGSFKPDLLMEWWWVFILFFMLVYVFYKVLKYFTLRQLTATNMQGYKASARDWAVTFLFVMLMYGGLRGGFTRPITIDTAFVGEDTFTGNLALNSAFTVFSTLDWGDDEEISLVPKPDAIRVSRAMVSNSFDKEFGSEEYPFLRRAQFEEDESHYNVVFLLIESLNASKVGCIGGLVNGESITPNLDSLVRHGRMYNNYYSNGVRSVEAVPAVLNSMPEIFRRPTIWSHFAQNTHYGLGQILAERGYYNAFFCGAHNGTMGFDTYSKRCGIDNYYGMNEYPFSQRDFNGYWGCHDGPFLGWMGEKQNEFKEPFMSVFFSISNHHPFDLPDGLAPDISAKKLSPMEKTTMYTDRVLGEYFRQVRQYDWFERTIFVVTGDHCFHEGPDPRRTILDNFRVPLLLVGPCIEPGIDNRIGNHVSLMPTIIDMLKLDTWHASAGVSLLEENAVPFAINSLMGVTTLTRDSIAYSINFEAKLPSHILRSGKWLSEKALGPLPERARSEMDYRLRCLYQCLHNARVTNRFHAPIGAMAQKSN